MTAKVVEDKIVLLQKTLFPSGNRYAISNSGLAVCLDKKLKLIIYGNLTESGEFINAKLIPFPDFISPKSLCIVGNHIILGGENDHTFYQNINSHELVVAFSIEDEKFTFVEMPFKENDKCIDDLLVDGCIVTAVDNTVYPKYLILYDFQNPCDPKLVESFNLPENGTHESIHKGTRNQNYLALTSTSFGMNGFGVFINLFKHGDYSNYIRLSQGKGWSKEEDKKKEQEWHAWRDILLLPNKDRMLISCGDEGVGIYTIDNNLFKLDDNEDSESVQYFNPWGKALIKILLPPNNEDHVILIFEQGSEENPIFTYSMERTSDLLESADNSEGIVELDDYSEFYDLIDPFENHGDSQFCEACQESPCMCSDRERTSTVYDY